ncbi:MAG: cyclic lactone autoinducer peptide [Proteocatella sp.]
MKKCFKQQLLRLMNVSAALSLIVATLSANAACSFLSHQPEVPSKVKSLRKF